MKDYFVVSLCKNGMIGGGIVADLETLTYKTGKLTVPVKYRNIQMRYTDICAVETGWFLLFPTVTLKMKREEAYKFVVFARKRFVKCLQEKGVYI